MRQQQLFASGLCLLTITASLVQSALAQTTARTNRDALRSRAVVTTQHTAKVAPATPAVEPETVQPKAALVTTSVPALQLNRAELSTVLQKTDLQLEAINAGRVVAASDEHAETVTAVSVVDQVKDRRVLIERTTTAAKPVALSRKLRLAMKALDPNDGPKVKPGVAPTTSPGASPNAGSALDIKEGLQLGYRLTAYQQGVEKPIGLIAVVIDQMGLLFDASVKGYTGTIAVALLNETEPDASGELERPVTVVVKAHGADELTPRLLKFERYGPEQPGEIAIRVRNPEKETFPIAASANFGATYNHIDLAVSRPQIKIAHPNPDVIAGWGIGTTTLQIQVIDIKSPKDFRILFDGNTTGLSPNPVTLDDDGFGTVQWRSKGTGTSIINVATPGLRADPVVVTFDAPWLFLALAAMGGLIGAFLRGRGRSRWQQALVIGVVSAVLMVVAYAVGLRDWVTSIPGASSLADSGEAVILVLGALAALIGVSALVPAAAAEKSSPKNAATVPSA